VASPSATPALVLQYPLRGSFRARNSPARRVPSHGTHLMGTTYAIDLIPVDAHGRSAPPSWRSVLATEAPQAFVGFGAPVLAPTAGTVVITHDGEEDHPARRSQLSLLPYALSQGSRLRAGPAAIAGNHVIIAVGDKGPYVLLAHLRSGSVRVQTGSHVDAGHVLAQCGNSGNSTQPHVHLQATDTTHWSSARGIPIAFDGAEGPTLPEESEVVRATGPGDDDQHR